MLICLLAAALASLSLADHPLVDDFASYQSGIYGSAPNQTYVSSNITSPIFNYKSWRKDLVVSGPSDHLFMTLDYNGAGPYIFRDDDLGLVYADPAFDYAMNARVQMFEGRPWLTFWHGAKNRGDSQGFCVFLNEHYEVVWNVTLGPPLTGDADMHECEVTHDDTVLLTAYQDKQFDLTLIGGKRNDVLADSCFQEVDIRDGTVYYTWCASDHLSPDLTYWNYTSTFDRTARRSADMNGNVATSTGFDAYHINSLQKTSDNNYLLSLRNLKSLVYINGQSGRPIWHLNGKSNNFKDITSPDALAESEGSDGALGFGWQHEAKFWDATLTKITLFDNHELLTATECSGTACSRGRELRINTTDPNNLTTELVREYRTPNGLTSVIFGSMHPLPYPQEPSNEPAHGHLVSWGVNADFTEHTNAGELVRDIQYSTLYPGHSVGGRGVQSSRIYKQTWVGDPLWPPRVVADSHGVLWVSWNGATEVREWAIFAGDSEVTLGDRVGSSRPKQSHGGLSSQKPIFRVSKAGFETRIVLPGGHPTCVKIAAFDAIGDMIGLTKTVASEESLNLWYGDQVSFLTLSGLLV